MGTTFYYTEEAAKYSKISLQGEGTLYLSFRDLESLIHKHCSKKVIQDLIALDYGCGAGRSTRYLKSIGIQTVDGFDISESMIEQARGFDPEGSYQLIQSGALPKAGCLYDMALMSFVTVAIESKEEITRIFQEIARVLKKGGIFLSLTLSETFWNPKHQWVSYKQDYPENYSPKSGQKSRLTIHSIGFEIVDSYWTEQDIIGCAKEANLSSVEVHQVVGRKEDGIEWKDESRFAPYTIFVFRKN